MITDKLGSYALPDVRSCQTSNTDRTRGSTIGRRIRIYRSPKRTSEAGLSICPRPAGFVYVFSAVRNLFVPPRSRRSARATHLHRLNAMAEWKVAANVAA